jgi:pimeloyl-ACP methyl ester carboxylesterase
VLAGERADESARARLKASLVALRVEPYRATLRALVTTDFTAALEGIAVPTLIVVGDQDRVLPEAESRFMASCIKASHLVVIPRAGHLCNIEAPEEFNEALSEFLEGRGKQATASVVRTNHSCATAHDAARAL